MNMNPTTPMTSTPPDPEDLQRLDSIDVLLDALGYEAGDSTRRSLATARAALLAHLDATPAVGVKLTDDEIDALQEQCDCYAGDHHDFRAHDFARAVEAAAFARCATPAQSASPCGCGDAKPVAWRARGYGQFKTGQPGPWRYKSGAECPKYNDPECCDIEPLYGAPASHRALLQQCLEALVRAHSELRASWAGGRFARGREVDAADPAIAALREQLKDQPPTDRSEQ